MHFIQSIVQEVWKHRNQRVLQILISKYLKVLAKLKPTGGTILHVGLEVALQAIAAYDVFALQNHGFVNHGHAADAHESANSNEVVRKKFCFIVSLAASLIIKKLTSQTLCRGNPCKRIQSIGTRPSVFCSVNPYRSTPSNRRSL